ncbi:MAG TPA: hypothetical protein VMI72_19640, partial [Roseiarcus sp.]|nr:hypothetical protein [Roseiarcus sp.]
MASAPTLPPPSHLAAFQAFTLPLLKNKSITENSEKAIEFYMSRVHPKVMAWRDRARGVRQPQEKAASQKRAMVRPSGGSL